jgi:hypothetical protein
VTVVILRGVEAMWVRIRVAEGHIALLKVRDSAREESLQAKAMFTVRVQIVQVEGVQIRLSSDRN